jgi:DNA polymerase I
MKKFIVIDGNSLINRAFYALPLLTNSEGEYSNAVYGFCNMLVKAITEHNPDYIAVAFDRKEPTFRHKLYADYKGTRKGMPEELAMQMPILKKILQAMNIRIIEQAGIEADDIIGIITKRFKDHTIILTGDKDNLQLIDDSTSVWLTKKGLSELQEVNEKVLLEEYNLKPYQVVELKALMGDSSDNIPGVPGIGEKTGMRLIADYDNLDGVYANIEKEGGKLKEKLLENKELAYLSKELATINTGVPLDIKIEECTYDFPFKKQVYELFSHYEFKSLLKRQEIFEDIESFKAEVEHKIRFKKVESIDELRTLIKETKKAFEFSFYLKNYILNFSISRFEEYEIKIKENMLDTGLDLSQVLLELKPILESDKPKKVLYDYKTMRHLLKNLNIELRGVIFDVNLAEYLISGSKKQDDNLLNFTNKYSYPKEAVASCILKAKFELEKELRKEEMLDLYYNIEFKLIDVLFDMEISGFKIDMEVLEELNFKYNSELAELTKKIYELAGEEFNINSPKQLSEILFDKLNLKTYNNKKKSTSIDVLEKLLGIHPIIELIMRYRHLAKLNGTYLEGFKSLIDKKTNLVHTVFNQTITSTGRLSSTEPNLQNIPIRTEDGKNLRKMFVSRFASGVLVVADYSQIELRLMAHYSQDKNLIEAYKLGKDIHAKTASDIFGVAEKEVTPSQRRDAKAVNFGIIYGISEYGLSQNIGSTRFEAKDYIDKYFVNYPGVKQFMQDMVELAREKGYVSTLMGRKRKIENINASNYIVRQGAERAAMNMPLQGTASDIIKVAMIRIFEKLNKIGFKAKLILQVHDELIIDTPIEEKDVVMSILKKEMELVATLKVPLVAEVSFGKNWYDTK